MNYLQFKKIYNINLNENQERAVQATEGAVLLLAVPGSGKTTVLVNRLGYMTIAKKIKPEHILTMTYTVAATHDMKERYESIFGETDLEFRTINGVCAKIIAHYAKANGSTMPELVTNESELNAVIRTVYREVNSRLHFSENDFLTDSDLLAYKTAISFVKNMMLTGDEIDQLDDDVPQIKEVFEGYKSQLEKARKMDYDDQLVYAYRILKKYPDILAFYQNKYRYICVDEAQDTSKIQHKIIELLAKKSGNVFMVGDEDQSIYGFRAAYPQALMNFEKTYPHATVLYLKTNYRSNSKIIEIANDFIKCNKNRRPKVIEPSPNHIGGSNVRVVSVDSRLAQYNALLKELSRAVNQHAVLFRNNESAIALISLIEQQRLNIEYFYRGSDTSFFSNKYVIDIVNILKFAANPKDVDIFQKIYYKLFFSIKKDVMLSVCRTCRQYNISVFDAIETNNSIYPSTKNRINQNKNSFLALAHRRIDVAIDEIIYRFGYVDYLKNISKKGALPSVLNKIETLVIIGSGDRSTQAFVNHLKRLKSTVENGSHNDDAKVILSTVHSSKGLEYNTVSIIDVIHGVFPVVESGEKHEDTYEEERRIFYVGMTRAESQLTVYKIKSSGCPFADEIKRYVNKRDPAAVEAKRREAERKPAQKPYSPVQGNYIELAGKRYELERKPTRKRHKQISHDFKPGMRIHHKRFGNGIIKSISGNVLKVDFESHGTKRLSIDFVLEKGLVTKQ